MPKPKDFHPNIAEDIELTYTSERLQAILDQKTQEVSTYLDISLREPIKGICNEKLQMEQDSDLIDFAGRADYSSRVVKIDLDYFRRNPGRHTVEWMVEHEVVHFFEYDYLEATPFYDHMIHARLEDSEKTRVLKTAEAIFSFHEIQEYIGSYLWGWDYNPNNEVKIQKDIKSLLRIIEDLELFLLVKSKNYSYYSERSREKYANIISIALNHCKSVFFALLFSSAHPRAIFEFGKKLQKIKSTKVNETEIKNFKEEYELAQQIKQKYEGQKT